MSFSDWELIDNGSFNGVKKYIRSSDEDEGTVQIKYEGHDAGIIEENKRAEPLNKRADSWHVGHIPASVGLKWLVEEGLDIWNPDHRDGVLKKLMDSDYRHLVPGLNRIIMI